MFWTRDLTTSKGFDTMLACKRRCIEWHIKQAQQTHDTLSRVTFARACMRATAAAAAVAAALTRITRVHDARGKPKQANMHTRCTSILYMHGLWAWAQLAYAYVAIRCLHLSSTSSSRGGKARRREELIHSANEAPHSTLLLRMHRRMRRRRLAPIFALFFRLG